MDQAVGAAAGVDTMAFRLVDPQRRLAGVRLVQHAGIPGELLDFSYESGVWQLVLPRPPIWRLEYKLALLHPDGGTEEICDPGNPRRVVVRNDSAGLGIPRGSVRNLANVSEQVKQNGFAQARVHNSVGSSISTMSPGVRSGPGLTPMGRGTSPRMSAPHSVAPAHSAPSPHTSAPTPHR